MTTQATQAFYDRWARAYDWLCRLLPGIDGLRGDAIDALALSPGDTAVDLGCGTGANLPHLRERVGPTGTVVGLDLTPGMLQQARARVERNGWENVHLARADAADPPVRDVDAVFGSFVVGMLADPGTSVARWTDCLTSGGRVAVLEAGRTAHRVGRVLNPLFDQLVAAGSPDDDRDAPSRDLDARIEAARRALADETHVVRDEQRVAGFIDVVAGETR